MVQIVQTGAIEITDKKNGNGKDKMTPLKIIMWNVGSKFWFNKVDNLNHMIMDINPDLAVISEANLQSTTEDQLTNIKDYDIITTLDYSLS